MFSKLPFISVLIAVFLTASNGFATECVLSKDLTTEESSAFFLFNAHLSHLQNFYGKPDFETHLEKIVQKHWPKTKFGEVTTAFYERISNLADQARLKNSIAFTIGLDHPKWEAFESIMRAITLGGNTGGSVVNPFEKTAIELLKAVSKKNQPATVTDPENWKLQKAEALLRTNDMFGFLARWRVINGEIIDQRASASAQKVAMVTLGLVGAGVLYSSMAFTMPAVVAAGAWVATLPVSPALAGLVAKTTELSVGSLVGIYGSPGAFFVNSAYNNIASAETKVANKRTDLSCELSKQIDEWRKTVPENLFANAITGAKMGATGAVLSFSPLTAKLIFPYIIASDSVEAIFVTNKLRISEMKSISLYKIAEEAEAEGHHDKALELLSQSREFAQKAGAHALEAILIGSISHHTSTEFKAALAEGEAAIRRLLLESPEAISTSIEGTRNLIQFDREKSDK